MSLPVILPGGDAKGQQTTLGVMGGGQGALTSPVRFMRDSATI